MFKTLCAVSWDTSLQIALTLALLTGSILLIGTVFLRGKPRRIGSKIGLLVCGLSAGLFICTTWFSATPRCRVARVVRDQVSHDYVSAHFTCDDEDRTLRGVTLPDAEKALAQCDEDHWDRISKLRGDSTAHYVLRCQPSSSLELWADHFVRWNGPRDWDVCFTACRSDKCSASTVTTRNTE
jgi:hypothetical protein